MASRRPRARTLALALMLLFPALLLFASPAAACHGYDHRFYIRGKVTFDDGSTQAGILVKGKDPTPSGSAEPTCPEEGSTDLAGRYEVAMHMHPSADNGDSVSVQVLIRGEVVASKTVVADLQPSQPATFERFKDDVGFVIPLSKKETFDIGQYAVYVLIALVILLVAAIVVWDVRRVRGRRIAEQVEKKRGAKLTTEERKERAGTRKMVECDTCGAKVRADRMDQHVSKVHPRRK